MGILSATVCHILMDLVEIGPDVETYVGYIL